jgi:hypothetical protein
VIIILKLTIERYITTLLKAQLFVTFVAPPARDFTGDKSKTLCRSNTNKFEYVMTILKKGGSQGGLPLERNTPPHFSLA